MTKSRIVWLNFVEMENVVLLCLLQEILLLRELVFAHKSANLAGMGLRGSFFENCPRFNHRSEAFKAAPEGDWSWGIRFCSLSSPPNEQPARDTA